MLIGICGGIGSGKSVVSRVLRQMGMTVYDCDAEARRIMNSDPGIKCHIRDEISADVTDGESAPDRKLLADIVFSNEEARKRLNAIVHGAVRSDLEEKRRPLMWVEAAILAESGIADMCDEIWSVESPPDIRIRRIVARDKIAPRMALKRIASQAAEERMLRKFDKIVKVVHNDEFHSILAQVENLLKDIDIAAR